MCVFKFPLEYTNRLSWIYSRPMEIRIDLSLDRSYFREIPIFKGTLKMQKITQGFNALQSMQKSIKFFERILISEERL